MNGFYPVLNEVHDKAAKELPLAELALFEHIWRKLIGWGKFEDEISISQLVNETTACRASIIHLLKKLEEKRWIVVTRQSSVTNRKFTSKIAIPACPGIESRLGWSKKQTRGGTESIPGGGIESRHTTDTPKDSLKDKKIPPSPHGGKFTKQEANDLGVEINQKIYEIYCVGDSGHKNLIHDIINTHGKQAFIAKVRESKAQHINFTEALEWIKTTLSQ